MTIFGLLPTNSSARRRAAERVDDLARALGVDRVFVDCDSQHVEIHVPRDGGPRTVVLREILDTVTFRESGPFALALGLEASGAPLSASLEQMSPILVGGTTGSGKSSLLHAFICSLLLQASPDQLRLVLLNFPALELEAYKQLPHLMASRTARPLELRSTLHGLVAELQRRTQALPVSAGQRLASSQVPLPKEGRRPTLEPAIIVVVDELLDLGGSSHTDALESLLRLVQTGSRVGIYCIVSTQRPTTEALQPALRASWRTRICFRTPTAVESRRILGQEGAEELDRCGSALCLFPTTVAPVPIRVPFVAVREVRSLASFWTRQARGQGVAR